MTTEEKLLELAWAVERITVQIQELADSSVQLIGQQQTTAIMGKMAAVNRRLMEVFPDLMGMPL